MNMKIMICKVIQANLQIQDNKAIQIIKIKNN